MIGGGPGILPGEITLAHNGVLFLDELPEFRRNVLEALRQPLEEAVVSITRAGRQVHYPARFQLIGAMNPCPCGHAFSVERACTCQGPLVRRYLGRISGPLLDRFGLFVQVDPVSPDALDEAWAAGSDPGMSAGLSTQVARAVARQRARYAGMPGLFRNGDLGPRHLERACELEPGARALLARALRALGLSARSRAQTLRVARTIADLEDAKTVSPVHLGEALQFRVPNNLAEAVRP